jgi:hypothetical protein
LQYTGLLGAQWVEFERQEKVDPSSHVCEIVPGVGAFGGPGFGVTGASYAARRRSFNRIRGDCPTELMQS